MYLADLPIAETAIIPLSYVTGWEDLHPFFLPARAGDRDEKDRSTVGFDELSRVARMRGALRGCGEQPAEDRVYLGGAFTSVNGKPRSGLAAINANPAGSPLGRPKQTARCLPWRLPRAARASTREGSSPLSMASPATTWSRSVPPPGEFAKSGTLTLTCRYTRSPPWVGASTLAASSAR